MRKYHYHKYSPVLCSLVICVSMIINGCGGGSSGDTAQRNTLDTNFGTGGIVEISFTLTAMLIQTDGKIVVAGSISSGEGVIARYKADGSLDQSFGSTGSVIFSLGTGGAISKLAIQSDGKIIAVGSSFNGTDKDVAILRISANGILDVTWGDRGQTISSVGSNEGAYGVALQSDGKIVVAGWCKPDGAKSEFLVARLNQDGSLDGLFGDMGVVKTPYPEDVFNQEDFQAKEVAIRPDGKILVAGTAWIVPYDYVSLVACYQNDGTLDSSFGTFGMPPGFISANFCFTAFLQQQDGKICLSGSTTSGFIWYGIIRYTLDGSSYDPSFGLGGTIETAHLYYSMMTQDNQGRIVAVGQNDTGWEMTLTRYKQDGTLDTSFGSAGGKVFFPTHSGIAKIVAIENDGGIVIGGSYTDSSGEHSVILRYIP